MPPSSTARVTRITSDPTSCDVGYKYLIGFADSQLSKSEIIGIRKHINVSLAVFAALLKYFT